MSIIAQKHLRISNEVKNFALKEERLPEKPNSGATNIPKWNLGLYLFVVDLACLERIGTKALLTTSQHKNCKYQCLFQYINAPLPQAKMLSPSSSSSNTLREAHIILIVIDLRSNELVIPLALLKDLRTSTRILRCLLNESDTISLIRSSPKAPLQSLSCMLVNLCLI